MGAVAGVRRTMKELVDGTIRVQVDIDPKYRGEFLKLFPSIDMPVALAPLIPGFELGKGGDGSGFDETEFPALPPSQIATFNVNEEEAKEIGGSTWAQLGPLCQSAIMLGKDERFQKWVDTMISIPDRSDSPEQNVADYIRAFCVVDSRKQLDEMPDAKESFRQMMARFRKWLS